MGTSDKKIPKVGLALGSGGAKGYAHIGVIRALENSHIPIDFIAGSSFGALVGCLYAYFKDSWRVEEILVSPHWRQVFSFLDPSFKKGLIKGERIQKFIDEQIKQATFDKLKIPFRAVATDFEKVEAVEISKGNVALAVRASICFPMVFEPVLWEGKWFWDGGLSNPVPANTARRMGADIVIAVNLDNQSYFAKKKISEKSFYPLGLKAIHFLQYHLSKECIKSADIVIEPRVGDIGLVGWDRFLKGRRREIILEGERSANFVLPKLKDLIL